MWPNSPAMPCRPRCTWPSMMSAPPMPVPRVMTTTCDSPRAAPKHASAQAAALASLSTVIGRPMRCDERVAQRLVAPGQVRREDDGRAVLGDEARGADADGDDVVGSDRRAAPRPHRRWCPRRRRARSSGAGCRRGRARGWRRSRRRRRRRPSCRRCRCRWPAAAHARSPRVVACRVGVVRSAASGWRRPAVPGAGALALCRREVAQRGGGEADEVGDLARWCRG